jgi:predicted  nucleic acid-binding Zn-ribbon protein
MNQWEQLLVVQTIDSRIQKLDHREAQLPERTRLAELEDRLAGVRAQTEAAEAEKRVLVKEQKRIEDEIAGLEGKIEHEESQLYGGGSSDAGLLQSLQEEIASLKRRISRLEDDELELMEQTEPIDARLRALAAEQADLDEQAIATTAALAEAEAELGRKRDAANVERAEAVAGIDDEALARYEKVRDRLGGTAVAPLESGTCGACHIKLSAVEHDRILHLPVDEEVRCEECDRFLVRT